IADSQSMNYRAFPGSYILMAWVGLLPCILLVWASCQLAWKNRDKPVVRFLAAWFVPYIAVLEIISNKPPLYMVQYVLPALAVAVAMRITDNPLTGTPTPVPAPLWSRIAWVLLGIFLGS